MTGILRRKTKHRLKMPLGYKWAQSHNRVKIILFFIPRPFTQVIKALAMCFTLSQGTRIAEEGNLN
jgi:hypothetical protein